MENKKVKRRNLLGSPLTEDKSKIIIESESLHLKLLEKPREYMQPEYDINP